MKKIKVKINKAACIQCGTCYSVLPNVYKSDDDGTSIVTDEYDEVIIEDPELIENILQTRDMCPTQAIVVEEIE